MSNPPSIPEIGGDVDLLLDVYTHASLCRQVATPAPMNEEYGDKDRLSELGANALDLAVTNYLYLLRPLLTAREMQERKDEITSDANIDMWLRVYKMKEKLRVDPDSNHVFDDPAEMRKYFHTFLGAIYIRNEEGLSVIQNWISALIEWSPSANGVNGQNQGVHDVNDAVDGSAGNPV